MGAITTAKPEVHPLIPNFQIPYTQCAVPGCTDVPTSWSRWCPAHTQRRQRAGHPKALLPRDIDLQRHRKRIARTLADLALAPAVVAAHQEADRLLRFRAPDGAHKAVLAWQRHMTRLRDLRTSPEQFLQRVCEVFFLDQDGFFIDRQTCEFALARFVLRLRRLHGMPLGSPLLKVGGPMLHDTFAVFALKLRKAVDERFEEAARRAEVMRTGWETTP